MSETKNLWPDSGELYVYIIIAQVLTGKSRLGSPDMIVPPPMGSNPLHLYDSVTDNREDIFVIFNGQQAFPEAIITCRLVSQFQTTHV